MRIEKRLTKNGFVNVAGLVTIDEYNEDVPNGFYSASAIQEFAEELEDIEGRLEVSIQNLTKKESGETEKALVARAEDTDVACVVAPLVPPEERGTA